MLYRADPAPVWMTDATIEPNGDLVITDGDSRNEWCLIVCTADKRGVLDALDDQTDAGESGDNDARLLDALARKFATGEKCYAAIEAFLGSVGVAYRSTSWMND